MSTGSITHTFTGVTIRHFEADGARTNSIGNTIGDIRGFRALIDTADENKDVGKSTLADMNVFVNPTISGIRIRPAVVKAFEEAHGRLPASGDTISFISNGDICAPTDNRIGKGQYVVKTEEAQENFPGNKDCVLEYTNTSNIEIEASSQVFDTVAATAETDVEELPW
jgi:hypothetical protein